MDTAGRVEKFRRKYEPIQTKKAKKAAAQKAGEQS